MTNQHPITPPPELVRQWRIQIEYCSTRASRETLLAQIFAAGADQELEACCEWFVHDWADIETADKLRVARRPKPPSLKKQALEALNLMLMFVPPGDQREQGEAIRRALEQLDD